jgi:hypothetical protein
MIKLTRKTKETQRQMCRARAEPRPSSRTQRHSGTEVVESASSTCPISPVLDVDKSRFHAFAMSSGLVPSDVEIGF